MADKRNFARVIAFKKAAKATGLTYEEVKAAYNTMFVKDRDLTEVEDKACRIARSVMYGYARKAEVPAEVPAEA